MSTGPILREICGFNSLIDGWDLLSDRGKNLAVGRDERSGRQGNGDSDDLGVHLDC